MKDFTETEEQILSENEKVLLSYFRELGEIEQQRVIIKAAKSWIDQEKKKGKK